MQPYLDLMKRILEKGQFKPDRTGTGTLSVFGHQSRYSLKDSFPLVTTKKIHLKSVIYELLWFLAGKSNVKFLNQHGVSIWDEWADDKGNLGRIYGVQWREWKNSRGETLDQISSLVQQLKTNPHSRRHLVLAFNPGELKQMALPPCHVLFQCSVLNGVLSCQMYQRSADVFLGVPFNIASYSLLTLMLAQVCHLEPGEFIHSIGEAHLYKNHIEQAEQQLSRSPRPLPRMKLSPHVKSLFNFKYEDFHLIDYNPHPHIKAQISV